MKYLTSFMAMVMFFSFAIVPSISAAQSNNDFEEFGEYQELAKTLAAIEKIPDSVLDQGSESVVEWLNTNTDLQFGFANSGQITTYGVVGCASAVGLALLGNFFSIAKLAKVKEAIQMAGGAKTFATALITSYQATGSVKTAINTAARAAGPQAREALLDFFYIGTVYSACFE